MRKPFSSSVHYLIFWLCVLSFPAFIALGLDIIKRHYDAPSNAHCIDVIQFSDGNFALIGDYDNGGYTTFIYILSPDGVKIAQISLNIPDHFQVVKGVVAPSDSIVLVGRRWQGGDYLWAVKVSKSLSIEWGGPSGQYSATANTAAISKDGRFVVIGGRQPSLQNLFCGLNLADGTLAWWKAFGATYCGTTRGIIEPSPNFFVTIGDDSASLCKYEEYGPDDSSLYNWDSFLIAGAFTSIHCQSIACTSPGHYMIVGDAYKFFVGDRMFVQKYTNGGKDGSSEYFQNDDTAYASSIVALPDSTFIVSGTRDNSGWNAWIIHIGSNMNVYYNSAFDLDFGGGDEMNGLTSISGGAGAIAAGSTGVSGATKLTAIWFLHCSSNQYRYYDGLSLECKHCPDGKWLDKSNPSSPVCQLCSKGTYRLETCDCYCQNCAPGLYQDEEGKPDCKECPVGTSSNINGRPTICDPCGPGSVQPLTGKTSCNSCIHNDVPNTAKTICVCEPGKGRDSMPDGNCNPCIPGFYQPDYDTVQCKICDYGYFASGSGNTGCTKCIAGKHASSQGQDHCDPCDLGTYQNDIGQKDCILCPLGKYQDLLGQTECKLCDFHFYQNELGKSYCKPCGSGKYQDLQGQDYCKNCRYQCDLCVDAYHCQKCYSGFYLKHDDRDGTQACVPDCGPHYYGKDGVCYKCDWRCFDCTGPTNNECTMCDSAVLGVIQISANSCQCGGGYTLNPEQTACDLCPDQLCTDCDAYLPSKCYSCSTQVLGSTWDSATFTCKCQRGMFRLLNEPECFKCNAYCQACTGPTNNECLANECSDGAYPIEGILTTCLKNCATVTDDLYLDTQSSLCKRCNTPCRSCFNDPDFCTSCVGQFALYNNKCVITCPDHFYNDHGICLPCSERCLKCEFKMNYCLDGCVAPFVFKDNQCLDNCGPGYAPLNRTCLQCDLYCANCIIEPFNNDSTESSLTLEQLTQNITKTCTQCYSPRILYEGKCATECPYGMFPNHDTGQCQKCHVACTSCFGESNNDCRSCNTTEGYLMVSSNRCDFPSCTKGFYYNSTTRTCEPCLEECEECENIENCTACAKLYVFSYQDKKCIKPCTKPGLIPIPDSTQCTGIFQ